MELIGRLTRTMTSALQPEARPIQPPSVMPMDDDSIVWLGEMPRWAFRWRQIVLRTILLIIPHTLTGSLIIYTEQLRDRKAQEAFQEYKRKAGVTSLTGLTLRTPTSRTNAQRPKAKGQPMRPSITQNYPRPASLCSHDVNELVHRHNQHKAWMTCLQCGSRWECCLDLPDEVLLAPLGPAVTESGSTPVARTNPIAVTTHQTPGPVVVPAEAPPPPAPVTETPVVNHVEEEFVHVDTETPQVSVMQMVELRYQSLCREMSHESAIQELWLSVKGQDQMQILQQFIQARFPTPS
jgi:hypothetical protein